MDYYKVTYKSKNDLTKKWKTFTRTMSIHDLITMLNHQLVDYDYKIMKVELTVNLSDRSQFYPKLVEA